MFVIKENYYYYYYIYIYPFLAHPCTHHLFLDQFAVSHNPSTSLILFKLLQDYQFVHVIALMSFYCHGIWLNKMNHDVGIGLFWTQLDSQFSAGQKTKFEQTLTSSMPPFWWQLWQPIHLTSTWECLLQTRTLYPLNWAMFLLGLWATANNLFSLLVFSYYIYYIQWKIIKRKKFYSFLVNFLLLRGPLCGV